MSEQKLKQVVTVFTKDVKLGSLKKKMNILRVFASLREKATHKMVGSVC